jgi:hypothetical protein
LGLGIGVGRRAGRRGDETQKPGNSEEIISLYPPPLAYYTRETFWYDLSLALGRETARLTVLLCEGTIHSHRLSMFWRVERQHLPEPSSRTNRLTTICCPAIRIPIFRSHNEAAFLIVIELSKMKGRFLTSSWTARRPQAAGPTIGTFLNSFQVTILPNLGSPMWVSFAASSPGAAGLVPQPYSFRSTSPGSAS